MPETSKRAWNADLMVFFAKANSIPGARQLFGQFGV
jgi:hypothetical protein